MTYRDKDWLYQEYIINNKSSIEIGKEVGVNPNTILHYLKKFDIKKDSQKRELAALERRMKTNKEKFGTEHYLASQDCKKRTKETSLKKYGTERPCQSKEVIEKVKKTNLIKYGATHILLTDFGKEKAKKTTLKKYGVDHHMKTDEGKEKLKKSILKNHGVEYALQDQKIREKQLQTMKERYGVEYSLQNKDIFNKMIKSNLAKYKTKWPMKIESIKNKGLKTKINEGKVKLINGKTLQEIAEEYNASYRTILYFVNNGDSDDVILRKLQDYKTNTSLEHKFSEKLNIPIYNNYFDLDNYPQLRYRPDFKLKDKSALNVDGLYWHSELNKDKWYHFNMRKDYEDLGLRIFQFHENEIRDKFEIVNSIINNHLKRNIKRIFARKTDLREVEQSTASVFLNENHMMGKIPAKHFGLFYENELVMIMSYKIYKDKIKIERFCSKINTNVVGGFSKLLKKIENIDKTKKIHYWVDLRYGTGSFLTALGFKHEKDTLGWKWTDRVNTFNRLACRANMDERCLTQQEHADELGWVKIYDAGQRLYVK